MEQTFAFDISFFSSRFYVLVTGKKEAGMLSAFPSMAAAMTKTRSRKRTRCQLGILPHSVLYDGCHGPVR